MVQEVIFWQHVWNLERAFEWYQNMLGLTHDASQSQENTYILRIPGQEHVKVALTRTGLENPKTHGILDLQTNDINVAHQYLMKQGANVTEIESPEKFYQEFHVVDPEGYLIKIHGFSNLQPNHAD